ncbi:MAG: hypothetical protein ACLRTQ_00440 [Candidatus Borkfalkia sp.]
MEEVFRIAAVFGLTAADYDKSTVIFECAKTESENDEILCSKILSQPHGSRPRRFGRRRGDQQSRTLKKTPVSQRAFFCQL